MSKSNPKILSIVLAGGEGTRLMPLTRDRAKPAVPFGGVFRLVDFPLSNLVNSGYQQVIVLTQYKSHSLDRHISLTWRFSPLLGNYVSPVPAQQRLGKHWYLGSADAIYQTINIIEDVQPDIVVIVGADHVYRMDFSQMVQQHIESGAECHGGRHPPADQPVEPVRRDRGRSRPSEHDQELPGEAGDHHRPAGRSEFVPGLDGQLRGQHRRPVRRAGAGREGREHEARHGRRHRPVLRQPQRGRRLRLQHQRDPRLHLHRSRLLARRGYAQAVLRCAYGT